MTSSSDRRLGVVIPALNEEAHLPGLLRDLAALESVARVVVVDGGSRDRTVAVARQAGALVVTAPPGRASQMNHGAAALPVTPWLLFLHADGRLGPGAGAALGHWLRDAPVDAAGVFRFALQGTRWAWRVLETGQRIRERVLGLPYGDQGLLVSREVFRRVGGYPEIPIMEDVALLRRLRSQGVRIRSLGTPLVTSGRRYERAGPFRGWARNAALMGLYGLGAPPERLARLYRPEPGGEARPGSGDLRRSRKGGDAPGPDRLLIFAKAPRPGGVKTRLARSLGEERAAELYRVVGREVVDRLGPGPYRTEVHFAPPNGAPDVRAWLDDPDLALRPQVEGPLGVRLREAFRDAFERGARAVAAVGTDAPDLTPALVDTAFRRLRTADVVLGPATDGGYYLVAVERPRPELFEAIPWSTETVLDATLERARTSGLTVALLPELRDVDRPEDLDALRDRLPRGWSDSRVSSAG